MVIIIVTATLGFLAGVVCTFLTLFFIDRVQRYEEGWYT